MDLNSILRKLESLTRTVGWKIDRAYWWVRHRVWPPNRYHVHKFRSLKPGWHDVDHKMLHACFDFFCDFVEKEDGLDSLKYQADYLLEDEAIWNHGLTPEQLKIMYKQNLAVYLEAKYLYDWWAKNKNKDWYDWLKDTENNPEELDNWYEIEDEHLCRLIEIRRYCWT